MLLTLLILSACAPVTNHDALLLSLREMGPAGQLP